MSEAADKRSAEFLGIAEQFKLGALVTESSHPVTANLSEVAKKDIAAALDLLFEVDGDVVRKYREFVESGRAGEIAETVVRALRNGGRIFFTGCGATGRLSIQLDSIWRDFWQRFRSSRGDEAQFSGKTEPPDVGCYEDFENRTFSVMAGGDFALIRSVEGFEDFTEFGKKQIGDLGVCAKDVVFAITEGGETSFVIGTAWRGVEADAKVYFVYNNPDELLCERVQRSREVIQDSRVEKINLTTGPMAITGSTRMQATSIQLCVMLTVLEMVVTALVDDTHTPDASQEGNAAAGDDSVFSSWKGSGVCSVDELQRKFLAALEEMLATLRSPEVLSQLARLVELEETVYRGGGKTNYYAGEFGIDVLTDTTERSPTYCTPPFRKFDDATASEPWAFLFLEERETPRAWERILKRKPRCVEWNETDVRALVSEDKIQRVTETIRKISATELMRFKIGQDGLPHRPLGARDGAVAIVAEKEKMSLYGPAGFHRKQLEAARDAGARTALVFFGSRVAAHEAAAFPKRRNPDCVSVAVPVPQTGFFLDGVTRVGVKLLLNALSTCTMVRLGRVMGNFMVYVVPSNLKLIDRATRYISKLTGLEYERANRLLFEVIEYVEPRMKSDQSYPPVVGLAVLRHRRSIGNEEAERMLAAS